MICAEAEILIHALLDGELDAGHAREVEAHAGNLPALRRATAWLSRAAAGHAGRAAALYGADELAPAHRERAAGGAPARLEPPLRAEGLCHGHGALGCDGGEPRRRRHSNGSGPARARRRRVGACALAPGRPPDRRADERPAHGETMVQRQARRRAAGRRPDSAGLQADRRAARLYRRQGRRFDRLSAPHACDQSLCRAGQQPPHSAGRSSKQCRGSTSSAGAHRVSSSLRSATSMPTSCRNSSRNSKPLSGLSRPWTRCHAAKA